MTVETIGRPMEILLIEDSLMSAKLAAQAVRGQRFDHRLTWISDGQDALAYLLRMDRFSRAPHPDLVLLDLILPNLAGIEILKRLRGDALLAKIPVVVMTAETTSDAEQSLSELGVQGYLTKPFQATEFQELVLRLRGYWRTGMLLRSPNDPPPATGMS